MHRWQIILCIVLGVTITSLLGVKGFQKVQLTKEEQQRKEIYRIEKLIAQDTAKNYEGIKEVTFTDYGFYKAGDNYLGFLIKINKQNREYRIIFFNDTNFSGVGKDNEVIGSFYKENNNKSFGEENVNHLKINYYYDRSKYF